MGNLVTGGLGQPEDGALVSGGLGSSGEPEPGTYLTVRLAAESIPGVSIEAHVTERRPATAGGVPFFGYWARPAARPRKSTYLEVGISAEGGADASMTTDLTFNFDAELEQLVLLGVI